MDISEFRPPNRNTTQIYSFPKIQRFSAEKPQIVEIPVVQPPTPQENPAPGVVEEFFVPNKYTQEMTTPLPVSIPVHTDIPCCSPATTESVAVVRDKVADARADILVGEGAILKAQGDYTSSILQNACGNTAAINANTSRDVLASMSQTDKYGLANLSSTRQEADRIGASIDRATYGLAQDVQDTKDKVTGQATTIAWSQNETEGRRFDGVRAQVERINEAQSAQSDRAFKYLQGQTSDSFARLSAQGEAGFYRTNVAIERVDRDVLKSECSVKEAIAAAQAAAAECCCEVKEEVLRTGKELGLQAAQNFGAIQLEAAKNKADLQLQAAVNHKESLLEQSKWFALAEKTAMVNKCELADKLAACCCEIKEVVTGTANATQSLIQATEATRVRDALSAANTENAILKLRREEHHHYPHYYPYHHHGGSRRNSRGD